MAPKKVAPKKSADSSKPTRVLTKRKSIGATVVADVETA